jgi:hypothetical protein
MLRAWYPNNAGEAKMAMETDEWRHDWENPRYKYFQSRAFSLARMLTENTKNGCAVRKWIFAAGILTYCDHTRGPAARQQQQQQQVDATGLNWP